ncbi:myoglobin-like isoform X1 [Dreissena polymorpha]|uniref:Indoleamine 2,3-dioxygenase 2-like n=2 Tax=Dreissena polymorpha TaxID=45954 RepID=A0A9D4LX66_DREPO|nr:myoglobin-like isoform X1 [Dreissena polymorpha]KAH3866363.1 hypothetical protein DPMN_029425 [Dreissena polymorpha]
MDIFPLDLNAFKVSEEYGFMLIKPLKVLPDYFSEWNTLAQNMAELVQQKTLRGAVDKMALFDHHRLQGYRELRLAHLQLSIIASGYIWQEGDSGAAKVLPACLAVPWHGVSMLLGIQPVLCHPSLVLANWTVDDQGVLQSLYNLPGGDHAEWFVTVTAQVELAFAKGLKALMQALTHAQNRNVDALVIDLQNIKHTVQEMKKAFSKMHEKLSAETFYDVLRPFLSGWGGDGSPLPDGVVYTGISDEPLQMTGGSAAQSSTLQCIDAVLRVRHGPEIRSFLENMRNYMPPAHKEFIETIEEHSQVKLAVAESHDQQLTAAYNECLESVVDFRSYHVQIVTKYIVLMANRETRNKDYEALATRGTGGSSILPFLKSLRSTTSETRINDNKYSEHKS